MPIDKAYLVAQLKALLAIDSPTGYTDQVVRYCYREIDYCSKSSYKGGS